MHPVAPIGGEELYGRQGLSGVGMGVGMGGGSSNREEHFFRKCIKEAGIDLGF